MRIAVGITASLTLLAVSISVALLGTEDADACGGFLRGRYAEGERAPSLAYEQTLISFDPAAGREHFVREVVFRHARERFGFVVPTPSRPEVAAVAESPFTKLREAFPLRVVVPSSGYGRGAGGLRGRGGGVQVLERTKVGSFTAFVLAADDAGALARWLRQNGLVSSPETDAWLAHYVRMRFFYVAMRYDPPAQGGEATSAQPQERTRAETVRISFDSPLPYYPYFEPDLRRGETPAANRLLEIWLVSTQRFVPVSARTSENRVRWVQPFAEGQPFAGNRRRELASALGAEASILPAGAPIVQRFVDQKVSRAGFGDVLFVPRTGVAPEATARADLQRLLPIVDPELLDAP